ncbi:type IV pilus assembly protein PilE [Sphaerotilus hippei]|uniref:Type IV pilus assembly protein PilE n=1 Tax=Sphaerotilus hippei TaxID=744406 RepID=A0A318H954_9BURK|nr:type IV pilin protein [Sphaerotilus hippei]PXW98588.1 type IV pilus assembly protein PilE [Sphaerotilus hippei]
MTLTPARPTPPARPAAGFTLIELLVAVAIIGILATLALPSYTAYLRRGDSAEGLAALNAYRATMEQYYQDRRSYGTGTFCAGTTSASVPPSNTGLSHFTMGCALTSAGYTLTATGSGPRTTGYVYTLDQAGTKGTTKYAGTTVSKACWVVKGGEC